MRRRSSANSFWPKWGRRPHFGQKLFDDDLSRTDTGRIKKVNPFRDSPPRVSSRRSTDLKLTHFEAREFTLHAAFLCIYTVISVLRSSVSTDSLPSTPSSTSMYQCTRVIMYMHVHDVPRALRCPVCKYTVHRILTYCTVTYIY